jgi:hypothetical protein
MKWPKPRVECPAAPPVGSIFRVAIFSPSYISPFIDQARIAMTNRLDECVDQYHCPIESASRLWHNRFRARAAAAHAFYPNIQGRDGKHMPKSTWKPHEKHGQLTKQSDLPDSVYAFPKQRKEPLTDAKHVRNAVARFDQVIDVSDADRALAFANIEKAASHYGLNLSETSWLDLGAHPQTHRKEAAAKGAVTRKRREQS